MTIPTVTMRKPGDRILICNADDTDRWVAEGWALPVTEPADAGVAPGAPVAPGVPAADAGDGVVADDAPARPRGRPRKTT